MKRERPTREEWAKERRTLYAEEAWELVRRHVNTRVADYLIPAEREAPLTRLR